MLNVCMQKSHFLHSQTVSVGDLGGVFFLVKHSKNTLFPSKTTNVQLWMKGDLFFTLKETKP